MLHYAIFSCIYVCDHSEHAHEMGKYKVVTCIGRQPDSTTYILNHDIQLTMKGDVIPPEQREFVWVEEILAKTSVIPTDVPLVDPEDCLTFYDLLSTMCGVLGRGNLYSGIMVLGKP